MAKAKLGTGARFAALTGKLAKKSSVADNDADDPKGLAAFIGRKKFGKSKFQGLAAAGRGK